MDNKGFTLIELLGVIVILTILSLITIPIIDSSLNKGKEGLSKTQEQQLIKGLKDYYAENIRELNNVTDEGVCKRIEELQKDGYLPASIKDPKKNEEIDASVKVCIRKSVEGYEYKVEEN